MTKAEAIARFLLAFALTQLIEIPIYKRGLRVKAWVAFGASAMTHPVVWFVMPIVWRAIYLALVRGDRSFSLGETGYFLGYGVLAEGFAVAAEAIYFWKLGSSEGRAFGWAIVANATSSLIGLGIRGVTGWP